MSYLLGTILEVPRVQLGSPTLTNLYTTSFVTPKRSLNFNYRQKSNLNASQLTTRSPDHKLKPGAKDSNHGTRLNLKSLLGQYAHGHKLI